MIAYILRVAAGRAADLSSRADIGCNAVEVVEMRRWGRRCHDMDIEKGKPFVLIVDDDGPIRNLVRQVLKRIGLEAMEARDGAEAVELLGHAQPDLMVLDLMMPKMNGWEVLEFMRREGKIEQTPVIVLTAVGAQRTENLPQLGVRAVLNKPFEIHDLIATAKRILEQPAA
jgi:CheY-like chemotaxis protein